MAYTTINKPTDYFNTVLYEGNGATGRGITGVGHQPDLVWIKNRDATTPHVLTDAVRGATVTLNSNDTSADDTISNGLTAFGTDGFTIGGNGSFNYSNESFVSWNWKANGAGSANTDGSISSTVSANTTSGFSIVSYTGTGSSATVGHGLGASPNIIINKKRSGGQNWNFQNSMRGYNEYLGLNTVETSQSTGGAIISSVSSTTFTCDGNGNANESGATYIAYCFAEKTGYSKFGSYTGNGNADGPFIYTGFKPAFILQKRTDATSNWHIFDIKRETYNSMNKYLLPNDSGAESTAGSWDFLSNGFKVRSADNWQNASNGTYIYMCFAEAPLVGTNGVTAKAR